LTARRAFPITRPVLPLITYNVPSGFRSSSCRHTGATRRWPAAAARAAPEAAAIRTAITTVAVTTKRTGTRAGPSRPRASTWTTNRRRRKSRRPPTRRRPPTACP